ncbi:hypothetical protein MLD38_002557 [Melastoma candidum]|nr:hypothetical protein MLD38_002557 [Melastoma candidum]
MKKERQAEEKQNEEETDGARKKRLVENKHVLIGTTPTVELKFYDKFSDKGNEKEVGGNFNCSGDIEDTREPAENFETTGCKKGKHGREKNGGSNVESEEKGNEQSKCRGEERSECELTLADAEDKGKLVKQGEKKKKKEAAVTSCLERNGPERKKGGTLISKILEKTPGKSASKKVTFAENDEVFTFSDSKKDVAVGKRYTKEEDELLKQAVHNYIESHRLGDNGLEMVLHCRSHKQKGCWREISKSLPWRSYRSIYYRAHTLFERAGDKPDWSPEELELVLQHHKKYGPMWKQLAEVLGKYRYDVKNMFRIINHGQLRRGKWTPEELDTLYELVNKDLRMSMNMEKKTHQGIFRDNIAWTALSEQLGTRHFTTCCTKWYRIASPMVSQGIWNDSDDYRLVDALVSLDKCSFVEVDWDNLLEHRTGELCVRRWKELIRSVDRHYTKTFAELVEILSKRYAWDVLEAREAVAEMT